MERECLLPHSKVPATCPYPQPARSSPYPHIPQTKITFTKVQKCVQVVNVVNNNVASYVDGSLCSINNEISKENVGCTLVV